MRSNGTVWKATRWVAIGYRFVRFGVVVMAFAIAGVTAADTQQTKRPNILVIWGNNIGWPNISVFNHGM